MHADTGVLDMNPLIFLGAGMKNELFLKKKNITVSMCQQTGSRHLYCENDCTRVFVLYTTLSLTVFDLCSRVYKFAWVNLRILRRFVCWGLLLRDRRVLLQQRLRVLKILGCPFHHRLPAHRIRLSWTGRQTRRMGGSG